MKTHLSRQPKRNANQNHSSSPAKFTREPECCPHPLCGSHDLRKRGLKKKKREVLQRFECRKCGRIFTGQTRKGRQYPLKTVLDALTAYYLGESSRSLSASLSKSLGGSFARATLFEWIKEYERFCAFARLRSEAMRRYQPKNFLMKETFHHRQIYRFMYHQAKAELIVGGFQHSRFKPVADFLRSIPETTRAEVFLREENRASRTQAASRDGFQDIRTERKKNYATEITGLVIETVRENKKRHELLQKFMLATDSVTVAVEVPIVYRDGRQVTTGHIDILQIRNGRLHVLDYKPNASKEKPYSQLLTYAQALEQATGISLRDMKCAWFDEHDYFEFSPVESLRARERDRYHRAA